ncbi:hypothetical protein U1Q18_020166 [Sarracenia purpurea var. burkii]
MLWINMEGQCGHENSLQLMPFAFGGNISDVSHSYQDNPDSQYVVMAAGKNQIPHVPLPLSHWIHCQQTSPDYVKYIAENGVTEIQKEMPYHNPGMEFSFNPAEPSVGMDFWKGQASNQSHSRVAVATPVFSPRQHNHISRRRATAADRSRKLRIAERLDALQELLPHPKEGDKASLLDDIIDHVKYLQLQIKDLSRSRLGGEATTDPFIFLEGYGHYLLHEQMLNEPLEEMMGKLLEVNPSAATQLLESRGLAIMPMDLADPLLHQAV